MPSSYTTSLRLTLPATGELAGQWGNTVNTGITELLDAAVAGTTTISTWGGAGVAYTLSNNSGTADEARRMFIVATGTPGEAKNVICPSVSKFYVFRNDTTGGFALTLKTFSGTGISVPAGEYKFLYCDGTNVVEMFNSAGALTLSGALSVGGTTTLASNPTLSAGTANQVQYLNASKVLTGSANLTFDGTDLTVSGAVNAGSVNATTLDLTNLEVTNIKAKDGTASASIADTTGVMSLVANPVLSGGTANGVLYLNGSKVATSGSALTFDGTTLNFGSTAQRITGDMSNATLANRLNFQNSVVNTNTSLGVIPNGTGSSSRLNLFNSSAPDNSSYLQAGVDASGAYILSSSIGTGTNLPLSFITGGSTRYSIQANGESVWSIGSEQMRLTSTGLGIGTSSPQSNLDIANATAVNLRLGGISAMPSSQTACYVGPSLAAVTGTGTNGDLLLVPRSSTTANIVFATGNGTPTVRAVLDSSGNLGIGTSSPGAKLDVRGSSVGGNFSAISVDNTAAGSGSPANTVSINFSNAGAVKNSITGAVYGDGYLAFATNDNTEKMRLTASGNLGIGTSSPAEKLAVNQGNFYAIRTGGAKLRLLDQNNEVSVESSPVGGGSNMIFKTSALTQMTLDSSGNLGIGTSSPTQKLDVNGAIAVSGTKFFSKISGDSYIWNNTTALNFVDSTGNTVQMKLDSSGNLGLGVTPSAWNSSFRAIQLGGGASFWNGGAGVASTFVGNNYFLNTSGNRVYIANGTAAEYAQLTTGAHVWYTAPSGTAGNTISFTQAMTLTAGGDLFLGQTSAAFAERFRMNGAYAVFDDASYTGFIGRGTALGTATASDFAIRSSNALAFLTGGATERARITSGGAFLVAQTAVTTSENLGVTYTGNNDGVYVYNVSASPTGTGVTVNLGNSTGTNVNTAFLYKGRTAGGDRFLVYGNGGIANYSANNVNLSDRREKTNFAPAKSYLDTICAIPVQTFNYIDQSEDDPGLTLGVVAQDVQAVAPELVMESNWGTADNPKMRLSIYQTDLQYALMKCVQELKAELDATKARLAALESN